MLTSPGQHIWSQGHELESRPVPLGVISSTAKHLQGFDYHTGLPIAFTLSIGNATGRGKSSFHILVPL